MTYYLKDLIDNYHIKQIGDFSHTIYIPIEELELFDYHEGPGMWWIFIEELGIVSITLLDTRRE